MEKITIDPITRIEGHLKVEVTVDNGQVKDARVGGTLFRGWEIILKERDPRDASQITQRVCGVCPAVHANASVFALDNAFGIEESIPENGRIIRNLILGANFLQSHILHFYHLASLDFFDVAAISNYEGQNPDLLSLKNFLGRGQLSPFTPRYQGDYRLDKKSNQRLAASYIKALEIRRKCHQMLTIFGGKMPHNVGTVAGGVTEKPTPHKIASFLWTLNQVREFIDNFYLPDVLSLANSYQDHFYAGKSYDNFLCYGAFNLDSRDVDQVRRNRLFLQGTAEGGSGYKPLEMEAISEHVEHSWYSQETSNLHPNQGVTHPEEEKQRGYSWLKAPRYKQEAFEVGPVARMIVGYLGGKQKIKKAVDGCLSHTGTDLSSLSSTLGRHIARALDAKIVADNMVNWVTELRTNEPVCATYPLPEEAKGMGITEGPRGALGHWIRIKDKKIDNYQLVVPTTWNASPRDDNGKPGPMEKALLGLKVKDSQNPLEVVRCVRSFDPCLACAVHFVTPTKRKITSFRVS